jgi:hypothetical protein
MRPRGLGLVIQLLLLGLASAEMSERLARRLNETMALQTVAYSRPNETGPSYNASTRFNPRGMGQLYNVTNMFIDLVQHKQAYPEGESSILASTTAAVPDCSSPRISPSFSRVTPPALAPPPTLSLSLPPSASLNLSEPL